MSSFGTSGQLSPDTRPTLAGIILDVSSSMKRNWKNRDGKKLPRIQIIRNVLNEQIRKILLLNSHKPHGKSIEVFVLGMGFKRSMYWTDVELRYGREKQLGTVMQKLTQTDVVCDLLALTEIVPSADEFQQLSKAINDKWNTYVIDLMNQVRFEDDVDQKLRAFIHASLHEKALRRFGFGIIYRIHRTLKNVARQKHFKLLNSFSEQLYRFLEEREKFIAEVSNKASERFFQNIIDKSKEMFDNNNEEYAVFIQSTIEVFVQQQCYLISDWVALGHPAERILDSFDESTIRELGLIIYTHLSQEVVETIGVAWQLNKLLLISTATSLGVKIDQNQLKELTEKCIQKYSWAILQPFVEKTVKDIFTATFETVAKEALSTWIGLASCREVTRSINDIVNILPDAMDESLYSSDVMFGTTPIYEAINRASLRLLDKKYNDYNKILIIVSDGEFTTEEPITKPALLLQKANITIVTCYVKERDIVPQLMSKPKSRWPKGAKLMFDMASRYEELNFLTQSIKQYGYKAPDGVKLFIQINHSELLGEVISSILSPPEQ